MNEILDTILRDTYTRSTLKHRLRILKSYVLNSLFGAESKEQIFDPEDLNWLSSLPSTLYQKFNKDNVYQIFESIEAEVSQLTPLIMYIPFPAGNEAILSIGSFVRTTFSSFKLIDLKFDPNLVAGCALVWKGVYRDYSLRARMEERKTEIVDSFKKFLR